MPRLVKGVLFADYVRMLRAAKSIAWKDHLTDQDLQYLSQRIEADGWYPMATYERMGLAILDTIAQGNFEMARAWGRQTIDELEASLPELFSSDPRETFMRFQVVRQALFNFPAAEVIAIRDGKATIAVSYGMSPRAEEGAAWQSVGFLERLIEISGGKNVAAQIESRAWDGAPSTRISVSWT